MQRVSLDPLLPLMQPRLQPLFRSPKRAAAASADCSLAMMSTGAASGAFQGLNAGCGHRMVPAGSALPSKQSVDGSNPSGGVQLYQGFSGFPGSLFR